MRRSLRVLAAAALAFGWTVQPTSAVDYLCDPANENCRTILIDLIRNETVGIDVAFWFMEDPRYTTELIKKHQAGVPVRVLVDPRANETNSLNAARLDELASAGIPMRKRVASGILHWKMMLFSGQNTVQFSGANYSGDAFVYDSSDGKQPYQNYIDEVIYFTDLPGIVNSFRTKYDDLWTNVTSYADYANIAGPLVRMHDTFSKDSELNFPPAESYRNRAVGRYNAETQGIDVIMYRITDRAHTDAILAAKARGVAVRLITEQKQYRDPTRLWHSWNVDRLYKAGIPVRHRGHEGLNHQKTVLLHGQQMAIFGSSNWTTPSNQSQEEHNLFTKRPELYVWLVGQFERKWNNLAPYPETIEFVPLPPDRAVSPSPASGAMGVPSPVTLKWYGGPWAHVYDVYLGTTPDPPLFAANLELGPSDKITTYQQLLVQDLAPGTTYYWKVVSKTMADQAKTSAIWSFTTEGSAPPPPPNATVDPDDIVLYASKAAVKAGAWRVVSDATAASGARIVHPDAGAPKAASASAAPADYFELTFTAAPGTAYRLWIRGKAEKNSWANDSVFVQFSDAVTSASLPEWRIGTTSATQVNMEDCGGCGLSEWGWQDNGYGVGVLGTLVYFETSGVHTMRVQTREDGISIDQIVLSPVKFVTAAPGASKNDTTILPEQSSSSGESPAPPPPPASTGEIVLYAAEASVRAGGWTIVGDATAAGGARMRLPDAGAAKIATPAAAPAHYFELTFAAEAGRAYRLWIRGRADNNHWSNDSVFVQFSGSVGSDGAPVWRIGTTSAAEWNLEDCSGCGLAGWGWQDNGYGAAVLGPLVYFEAGGTQTIRIQQREDGISIDQIVLSPAAYLDAAPGALKNDTTILAKG